MLIGLYHNNQNPRRVSRAYLYQAIAQMEGVELFYFISTDVNFETSTISGRYYHDEKWIRKVYPFPDVIINVANPKTMEHERIKNRLRKLVPFTTNPVGSKPYIYDKIIKGETFKDHIIPYREIDGVEDVLLFLNTHNKVIMKPVRGHHGDGIFYAERIGSYFRVIDDKAEVRLDLAGFIEYFKTNVQDKKFLVQKYISSRLTNGHPFDFRVHMQKDGTGKWRLTAIVPRIGTTNGIITNISQGNQTAEFKNFLPAEFENHKELKKKLETFALNFTVHFESLYDDNFDELGIDLGLDETQHPWIYEVNYRPGHVFIEVITAKNTIAYAKYLAKAIKGEV